MEKEFIQHKIISFIFISMSNKYKCLTEFKKESWNIKGTNLGGLFVLEPWITPSLFYQFLKINNPIQLLNLLKAPQGP